MVAQRISVMINKKKIKKPSLKVYFFTRTSEDILIKHLIIATRYGIVLHGNIFLHELNYTNVSTYRFSSTTSFKVVQSFDS